MFRALIIWFLMLCPAMAQEETKPAPVAEPSVRPPSVEEKLVVTEMSRVRLHPSEYSRWLKTQIPYFEGTLWRLPDHVPIRTEEGAAALEELIAFLERTPSVGPLRWSEGLSHAARQLVLEQGPTGQTGHVGPTGSTMQGRILKHGLYQSRIGEVINYGPETPRWTVMQLLIDDGVPGRGHRLAIFDPDIHVGGAATGTHAEYGEMTVVDLSDAFQDNPEGN